VAAAEPEEAVKEIRGRRVQGVGFGNIFGGGPINLRPAADKKPVAPPNQQKSASAPEPVRPSEVSKHYLSYNCTFDIKSRILFGFVQVLVKDKHDVIYTSGHDLDLSEQATVHNPHVHLQTMMTANCLLERKLFVLLLVLMICTQKQLFTFSFLFP